jgi:hypothetical protein
MPVPFYTAGENGVADKGDAPAGINVNGGQGVQIGSGSAQYNTWNAKSALDAASLSRLAPHTALTRLQAMPHDDLVDLFASASPGDVTEVLTAFLLADEAKAIAVLADISARQAAALIALLPVSRWLRELPHANEGIERKAMELRWAYQGKIGHLEAFYKGYARGYKLGRIFWTHTRNSATAEVISVRTSVEQILSASHVIAGCMPASNESTAFRSKFGRSGRFQYFDHVGPDQSYASIPDAPGDLAVFSTDNCMTVLNGYIWRCYHQMGGAASWLGFPNDHGGPAAPGYERQSFEGGVIYSRDQSSAIAVRSETLQLGAKPIGLPLTAEIPFGDNPDDRIQFFDKAVATLRDGKREIWFRP